MPDHVGVVLGMRSFGMSAPMKIVAEHFGFKAEQVAAAAKSSMRRAAGGMSRKTIRFAHRRTPMQLGMIGLGRMGANMAARLIKAAMNASFMTAIRDRCRNWSSKELRARPV